MALRLPALALLLAFAACGGGGNSAASDGGTATMAWTGVPNPSVIGYRVYFGTTSRSYQQPKGSGIDVGRVETYVVAGLAAGTLYYFAVTAFDATGNESDYSNEATKRMP